MLTRRNFERIAEIVKAVNIPIGKKRVLVSDLGTYFEEDNPRFDVDRFATACGVMYVQR